MISCGVLHQLVCSTTVERNIFTTTVSTENTSVVEVKTSRTTIESKNISSSYELDASVVIVTEDNLLIVLYKKTLVELCLFVEEDTPSPFVVSNTM